MRSLRGMTFDLAVIDLDNTLYAADNGVFARMDQRMNAYVAKLLAIPDEEANRLRIQYWRDYGTTLRGLMLHHEVDAEDFLCDVHDIDAHEILNHHSALDHSLHAWPIRKIIHTNGTSEHAKAILTALGISHHFQAIYDIRFRDYQPKPCRMTLAALLQQEGVKASRSIVVDDMPLNLQVAKDLGAKTCWVSSAPLDQAWDYHVHTFEQIPPCIFSNEGQGDKER